MTRREIADAVSHWRRMQDGCAPRGALPPDAATSRCGVTRYLAGCACFDADLPALAVQHLMIAHHARPELESAALLVFAGLSLGRGDNSLRLDSLLETWEEFRRPEFDRTTVECCLLDALAEPLPAAGELSPLARKLWRLPIRALRTQIRAVIATQDARHAGLLLATA